MLIEKKMPIVYPDVANWWYHYYSKGENQKKCRLCPEHFALSDRKCTPDFANLVYDYGICHPQIGATVTAGKSIVLMKTTVGCSSSDQENIVKSPYIVGYFRVGKMDTKRELIFMDPCDSLLLLDDPIKLDSNLAKKLFREKEKDYWDCPKLFVRRLGSTLRNKKASPHEIKIVLAELLSRHQKGAPNFLGKRYKQFTR